jgi:hypothetical protein
VRGTATALTCRRRSASGKLCRNGTKHAVRRGPEAKRVHMRTLGNNGGGGREAKGGNGGGGGGGGGRVGAAAGAREQWQRQRVDCGRGHDEARPKVGATGGGRRRHGGQ